MNKQKRELMLFFDWKEWGKLSHDAQNSIAACSIARGTNSQGLWFVVARSNRQKIGELCAGVAKIIIG